MKTLKDYQLELRLATTEENIFRVLPNALQETNSLTVTDLLTLMSDRYYRLRAMNFLRGRTLENIQARILQQEAERKARVEAENQAKDIFAYKASLILETLNSLKNQKSWN